MVGVCALLLGGAALWLYHALPGIAAAEIGRLINGRVETGAFYPHRDGSVTVRDLVIRPRRGQTPYDNAILRADHVYAQFDWGSLLRLSPRVTALGIEDFLLDVQLDLNTGRWNVGSLRFNAPSGDGGQAPVIRLVRGKLRYCKISGANQEVVMSIPVEAQLEPARESDGSPARDAAFESPGRGYQFEIRTAQLAGGYGESRLSGHWQPCAGPLEPGELTLAGGLSSTDIPSLERAWAVDVLAGALQYGAEGGYTLNLSLKGLHGKHAPELDMLRFLAPAALQDAGPVTSLREFFAEYQPTGTVGALKLTARGNLKKLQDSQIDGTLVCQDISVCDRDFPYPLDHLTGEIEFTESSMHAHRLVGRHGPVEVCLDGWARGDGDTRQYQYRVTSSNMVLDQALYAALDPNQKRLWDDFHPTGTAAVDYRLTRATPTDKRLHLSVDLHDVTAAFRGFPYPLTGVTGNLFFDRDSVTLTDIVAGGSSPAGGPRISIEGRVTAHPGSSPMGHILVEAKDLPLDATLRQALPARQRDLLSRFDANGLADIRARVFAVDDANESTLLRPGAGVGANQAGPADLTGGPRLGFLADVTCKKGTLKLRPVCAEGSRPPTAAVAAKPAPGRDAPTGRGEESSLVISDITAEATITPDSIHLRKLAGRHGPTAVAMTGGLLLGEGEQIKQCHLAITAQRAPLTEAVSVLLPEALAGQVTAFHPEGDVNLRVDLKKADSRRPPEYTVVVECLGDKIDHERFAYPLEDLRGTITLAKDGIVLKNVTAKPRAEGRKTEDGGPKLGDAKQTMVPSSVIRVDGAATLAGGAVDKGSFTLRATDIPFTENLGRALPKALAGLYRALSPQGPFNVDLATVKITPAAADEIIVGLEAKTSSRACRLAVSGVPMELAGVMETQGSYSTKHGFTAGHARLAAERMVVKGKTATHTDIDAVYDPNTQRWTAANFVGDCYGGKLLGTLEIGRPENTKQKTEEKGAGAEPSSALGPPSSGLEYQLRLALSGVDLQQFVAADTNAGNAEPKAGERELLSSVLRSSTSAARGTMDAALSVQAAIGNRQNGTAGTGGSSPGPSRRGVCRIGITDMHVGKVSPLGNVLSVLRLSEATEYTFEQMLLDSYLRGDKLLISKLDLSGRNAAFTGSGTMDLPTEEINLTLTARGQRGAGAGPSVLQSLTEGLSGAVVRMEVTGTAGNPHVQTKALPVIEDSLRILGASEEGKTGKK